MEVWTCEMSVPELVTLGSLCKHWRNTGIFSGKRPSFSCRKLFFRVKEAKAARWGLDLGLGARAAPRSPQHAAAGEARSPGRPLLPTRPNRSAGPSPGGRALPARGTTSTKITKIVPPGCI